MQVNQGEGGASGNDPQPSPAESAVSEAFSKIEAAPPEGTQHLVIIGSGYEKQLNAAVKNASNVSPNVVHLQSPLGFRSLVPHFAGITPPLENGKQAFVAEIAIIVDDAELIAIHKMPMRNDRERTERTQAIGALVGTVAASVNLLQQLPGPPSMSLYIWDEFDTSGRDPSTVVVEKLSRYYDKSEHVRILNQFPQDADVSLSAQTISVRKQWQLNLLDYRPLATSGPRLDLASGWTALALGMMRQAILGGAVSRLAANREANLEMRSFHVPITAVVIGDGRVLTNEEKRHTVHHHLISNEPDADFIAARHQHHTIKWRAQGVLNVGIAHRPPVGVLRGYVAAKSEATK